MEWYRIWSDGWIEQGFSTTHGGSKIINFVVPFKKYVFGCSLVYKSVDNPTTTRLTWHSINSLTLEHVSITNSDSTVFARHCTFWGY